LDDATFCLGTSPRDLDSKFVALTDALMFYMVRKKIANLPVYALNPQNFYHNWDAVNELDLEFNEDDAAAKLRPVLQTV